jgi:hypothetical protein
MGDSIPPGFPVWLSGVNEPHAAFLIESRTRCHGWGRAVGNPGSFAFFAKGGIPRISIPTVAYPTLCQERKGWGTRLFVVLPTVPNINRGLIENVFLISRTRVGRYGAPIVLWSLSGLLTERMLQRGARGMISAHSMDSSARRS